MPKLFQVVTWLAFALALSSRAGAAEPGADAILGHWVMQDGSALLEVERDGSGYRVQIVALLEPDFTPADGELAGRRRDLHNPKSELRERRLEGLTLARRLIYANSGWDGRIYDPGSGNHYSCRFSLEGEYLRVHGYLGVALLGRTVYWQRADRFAGKVQRMLTIDEHVAAGAT
jgi:uncharacterized protein (DUF2147 family)